MKRVLRSFLKDQKGASLAVTAVMLMALLSMIALAFDLGLLRTARTEAQRAADSAALAGASAFLDDYLATSAQRDSAEERATDYATSNFIRNLAIDTSEVTVTVNLPDQWVHVLVRRQAIPMWFARLFGINSAPVAASARARVSVGNRVPCIAPLAIPDWWQDLNNDANGNKLPDPGENWVYNPGTDHYKPWDPYNQSNITGNETGFGSDFRNLSDNPPVIGDLGRDMVIKPQQTGGNPNNPMQLQPGWFQALDYDFSGYGPNGWKGAMIDAAKGICPWGGAAAGDSLDVQNGKGAGPTSQAFQEIFDLDPLAQWDGTKVTSPLTGDNNSPRMLKLAIFPPDQISTIQGKDKLVPNNFAMFFVTQRPANNQESIFGKFMYYVQGSGGGTGATLVRSLQLIQ
jgi:hypothetical protein